MDVKLKASARIYQDRLKVETILSLIRSFLIASAMICFIFQLLLFLFFNSYIQECMNPEKVYVIILFLLLFSAIMLAFFLFLFSWYKEKLLAKYFPKTPEDKRFEESLCNHEKQERPLDFSKTVAQTLKTP